MFFNSKLFIPCEKKTTSQEDAWQNGYYETYKLIYELPAVRLRSRFNSQGGRWFAVDTYKISVKKYQGLMAMVRKDGRATFFKRPNIDWYILPPNTIFNVGIAAPQGDHLGGGLQFEYIKGQHKEPIFMGSKSNRRLVRL